MRRGPKLVTVLAACLSLAGPAAAGQLALAPGDPAPRLLGSDIRTSAERQIQWSEHRFTLVNFWATWCVPCLDEMPALERLHEGLAGAGLGVVGVHGEFLPDPEAEAFVAKLGVTYPVLRAEPKLSKAWGGLGSLPASFLVDSAGIIRRRYIGATAPQIAGLVADVEAVMADRPLPPLVEAGPEGVADPQHESIEILKKRRAQESSEPPRP